MAPTRRHYLTLNGQPPNGGFPPGWIAPVPAQPVAPPQPVVPPQPVASPQPVTVPPPPYVYPCPDYSYNVPLYPPVPTFVAPRPDLGCCAPGFIPCWYMQPGPPAPPPAPAPAPEPAPAPVTAPPFPQGAYLDGATVNFETNMNYLFPERQAHTLIHFFLDEVKPWESPGGSYTWAAFTVPTMMTVKQLIRQLGRGNNAVELDAISECIELGDGVWLQGSSFKLGDSNADQTLEALGWTEARGTVNKPVWIALYKT